jgi:hypothetical protein
MFCDGEQTAAHVCARWNSIYAGKIAATPAGKGYLRISISGRDYKSHRLAWLIMTGSWPAKQIDHANLDKSDNRFVNLREATQSQNEANKRAYMNNTSGAKGVSWDKRRGKWVANIRRDGRQVHLGYFDTIEPAASAYERAAREINGEFART